MVQVVGLLALVVEEPLDAGEVGEGFLAASRSSGRRT